MTGCLSTLRAIALATLLIFAALLVRRRWASRYVTLEQVEKLETSLTAVLDESLAAARSASDKLRAENAALRARLGEPAAASRARRAPRARARREHPRRRRRAAAAARRAGNHHRRRRDVRHGDALGADAGRVAQQARPLHAPRPAAAAGRALALQARPRRGGGRAHQRGRQRERAGGPRAARPPRRRRRGRAQARERRRPPPRRRRHPRERRGAADRRRRAGGAAGGGAVGVVVGGGGGGAGRRGGGGDAREHGAVPRRRPALGRQRADARAPRR